MKDNIGHQKTEGGREIERHREVKKGCRDRKTLVEPDKGGDNRNRKGTGERCKKFCQIRRVLGKGELKRGYERGGIGERGVE